MKQNDQAKEKSLFSSNLIRLRKERGLSQADLSILSGISNRMIGYYETNPAKPPIHKVKFLASSLNVEIEELIGSPTRATGQDPIFINLNQKTLNKIKKILTLSQHERHMVYTFVDSLLARHKEKNNESK